MKLEATLGRNACSTLAPNGRAEHVRTARRMRPEGPAKALEACIHGSNQGSKLDPGRC